MNRLSKYTPLLALAAIATAIAVSGCGSSTASTASASNVNQTAAGASAATASGAKLGHTVDASLNEWSITTKAPEVKAGKVTISATNDGAAPHELVVLKTDKPADSLGNGSRVSEKDSVGEVSDVKPGKSGKTTLDLKPGKYVLICNLPGHYMQGMKASLTVK
jgi:uncharacterized cupredoxin-like copper-binding protein